MAHWSNEPQPFGANHVPLMAGLASDSSGPVPLAVDAATGALLVISGGGSSVVAGAKSNNAVIPGSTNLGVLPAIANAAAPSWTEGYQVGLSTDLAGNLRVSGSLSISGTTDNSAFTAGTSTGTPAMGFYHSTIDAVTDGRSAALAIDAKRNLFTVLRDAAGNARGVNVTAGNALTIDGSAVTQPVSGTFWQATQPISGTVTANAGTNLNTSLLALETGGNLATLAGGVSASVYQSNVKQINGITPLMGNGTTGTGSQRVTIASDNTAFSVNATLSAETTKVIGVTRTADGGGNLLTSNSTTYTAKFGLDGNLLGTLGTAFSTAGKVDVKAADGDVFVRQATASNLNATVVGTGTFVTQSTLAAETTKVIGVTRTADGSGNLLTSTGSALDVNLKTSSITLPVSGTVTANPTVPTAVKYGQVTVAVTNTAVQLTNQALSGSGGVIVQALAGNAGNVVIGDSSVTTANGMQLQPGQAAGINIDNVNRLYVNGTSADGVCWIGS